MHLAFRSALKDFSSLCVTWFSYLQHFLAGARARAVKHILVLPIRHPRPCNARMSPLRPPKSARSEASWSLSVWSVGQRREVMAVLSSFGGGSVDNIIYAVRSGLIFIS
mmetsp:Transcript_51582/g.62028  ORF Transcript_51582/g.62028 Transcript_51582/m.62028 type:complete len:109 (+) Transcript_51582:264-590(+)